MIGCDFPIDTESVIEDAQPWRDVTGFAIVSARVLGSSAEPLP